MITVAVATPSRGLVHSRTVAAVHGAMAFAYLSGAAQPPPATSSWWVLTHDLPIPEAHERAAALALGTGADAVWFVEEDNAPPRDALVQLVDLLEPGVGMAAMDYPLATNPVTHCIYHDPEGEPLWCGLGCTLVPRRTFGLLPARWGTSGKAVEMIGSRTRVVDHVPAYGGQDVWLSHQVRAAGLRIAEARGYCGHLRVAGLGAAATNTGAHRVVGLGPVERFH